MSRSPDFSRPMGALRGKKPNTMRRSPVVSAPVGNPTGISWQQAITQTVEGMGYEVVHAHRNEGGLLRVDIDWPWHIGDPVEGQPLTIEDCERVTRQLQYVLEVEQITYHRLEVGSAGLQRPLKTEKDYHRFCGEWIELTFHAPMGSQGMGLVAANRKRFRGLLGQGEQPHQWTLTWPLEASTPPHPHSTHKRKTPTEQTWHQLQFVLSEVQTAKLSPDMSFQGLKNKTKATNNPIPTPPHPTPATE